jgi:histone H2A
LPGDLTKYAVTEGTKAVLKFSNSSRRAGKRYKLADLCGLRFPPARAEKFLKEYNTRLGSGAKIYLAAVLEYITTEILELSGNAARNDRKAIITPRHIMVALANDEELNKLERRIGFHSTLGGVISYIPQMYATKPKKKASRKPKKKKSRKPKKK